MHTKFYSGSMKGRHHLEEQGLNGRIILKVFSNKWRVRVLTRFIWLRIRYNGGGVRGSCVHGNEPSSSIKDEEFLD
jgi:hypothetical protein